MSIAPEGRVSLASAGLRSKRRAIWTAALPSTTGPRAQPVLRNGLRETPTLPRAPHPPPHRAARPMRTATMAERTAVVSITFLDPPCARTTRASPTRTVLRGRLASAAPRLRTTVRTLAYPVVTAALTRTAVPGATARLRPRRWNAEDRALTIAIRQPTRASTTRTVPRSTRGQISRPGPTFVSTTCKRGTGRAVRVRFASRPEPSFD
jgi:hypothetical protein